MAAYRSSKKTTTPNDDHGLLPIPPAKEQAHKESWITTIECFKIMVSSLRGKRRA